MAQQIILRKGTAAAWTSANPTLAAGEPGVETDTGKFKLGNGVTAWVSLAYAVGTIPTDVNQLADVSNLIPTNLADLADVASNAPSSGQVLKWNGTAWAPAADATGGGGGGATTLDELTDVAIVGTPAANSILKYVGGIWGAGTETSQTLSSATSGSGVNINLSNTGGTVKFAPGPSNNVTVTKVGENVEINSDDTSYTTSVTEGPSLEPRITLAENVNNAATGNSTNISILGLGQVTTTKTGAQTIGISAVNTTYSLSQQSTTGGVSTVISGTAEATALAATLVSGSAVVTLTAGSTKGLRPGLSISKTSGVGTFGTAAKILTVDSLTQLTLTVVHGGAGAVVFSATSVMQFNIVSPVGTGGLSITTNNSDTITITNTNGKVTTGTVNRLAMYNDADNLTTVGQTNDGISFDPTTKWTTMFSGRLALNNHDLVFTRQNIGAGTRNEGLLYQVFYDQAPTTAWNWTRGRGAQATPTPAQVGDELFNWRFYGQWGTTTSDLASAVRITGTVANAVTTNRVGGTITFLTSNGSTAAAARVKITADGYLQADTLQAMTTNGDLNVIVNGTGYVRLPSNTTIGGVPVGSIVLKGTRTGAQLTALTGMVTGDAYVCSSTSGIFVAQHIHLYSGAAWNDLGSFQGPAGADGADGADGTGATLTVGTVTTGAAGSSAVITNVGTSNAATFNFTIPRGDTGANGNAATIAVGTVTTLAAGASATVANSGTTSAAVFDFGLPAGATGAGVVVGGTTGQVLAKVDGTNYNTQWVTPVAASNSFATIAVAGQSSVVADTTTDTLTLVAGTNITITTDAASDTITINSGGAGSDTNTTYSVKATTVTGGATLDLDAGGSGSGTDSIKFASGTGITVARTDPDTITVSSTVTNTDTTYSINAVDGTTGKKIIRLTAGGSGSGDDDVTLVAGTNVTLDRAGDEITINSSGGGGSSMATRTTAAATTASIADGATGNIEITGFKSYALLKVQVGHQAWVRIYTDTASRTADASRLEGTDPAPGSGVVAEIITSAAPQTILITPGVFGFNNEGTPTTSIPIAVTNKSGTTRTITVTLTLLQLEA